MKLLVSLFALLGAVCGQSPAADDLKSLGEAKTAAGKLNVLFIIADDLRPELGCYGVSPVHSPEHR